MNWIMILGIIMMVIGLVTFFVAFYKEDAKWAVAGRLILLVAIIVEIIGCAY